MAKRKDTHRPSAIVPTEYEYVAMEHMKINSFGDCQLVLEQRERLRAHMASTGGTWSSHQHGGTCHVCGSVNAIYTHVFYHRPSNTYIRTGSECTDKLDYAGAAGDMDVFKTAIKDYRELQAGKRKAAGILAEAGLSAALDIREAYLNAQFPTQEDEDANPGVSREYSRRWAAAQTITDMVNKLVRYGNISEKALGYMAKLVKEHSAYETRKVERAAEKAAAAPCPTGRTTVTGTILKAEYRESQFGLTHKMLVKAEQGFTVWGTVPSGMQAERGAVVTFTATFEPSKDDPKFGFFKRPTYKGGN